MEHGDLTLNNQKSLIKRLKEKVDFMRGNTSLQQNSELYEYLKRKYGVKKRFSGIFHVCPIWSKTIG